MRLVKLFVAMACAFLLATAIAGAGIASADAPCKVSTTPCPEASTFSGSNPIKGELLAGTTVLLKNSTVNVKCTSSKWTGEFSTDGAGEFSAGEITTLTFGSPCETVTAEPCSVFVAQGLHYHFTMSASGAGNGTISVREPKLEVECGAGPSIRCTFTAPLGVMPLEVIGGNPAKAKANAVSLQPKGTICPASAELTAEYEIAAPKPLFIVKEVAPPVLCSVNTAPCAPANTLGTGTTIKASQSANTKVVYTYVNQLEPECNTSVMEGKTTAAGKPIVGELTSWTFTGCGAFCHVTPQRLPYRFEIERTGGGNGTLTLSSGGGGQPAFKVTCGSSLEECIYGTPSIAFEILGGTPATLRRATKVTMSKESGSATLCGSTASWQGVATEEFKYGINPPASLFVIS